MSDSFLFGWCIVLGVVLLPGTLWAMTRQARFQLSHLLLAMITYCAVLVPMKAVILDQHQYTYLFIFLSIALIPLIGGGILIGMVNQNVLPPERVVARRVLFLAGFLCPLAIVPALVASFVLMAVLTDSFNHPLELTSVLSIWAASCLPIAVTLYRKFVLTRPAPLPLPTAAVAEKQIR